MTDQTRTRDGDSVTRARHSLENGNTLPLTVVDAIAAHRETDPTELDPLHDTIDLEALETLVDSLGSTDGHVTFCHGEHDITVGADGLVTVTHVAASTRALDDEAAFQSELTHLVRTASANGVDIDGEWLCDGDADTLDRRVRISGDE